MTPKQKANQIYDQYWSVVNNGPVSKEDPLPDFRLLIEKAIIAAIEEEREACAKVAENQMEFFQKESKRLTRNDYASHCDDCSGRSAQGIMLQIRARSES